MTVAATTPKFTYVFLLLLFLHHYTTNAAIFRYKQSANLSTTWKNTASEETYNFADGTHLRPILATYDTKNNPKFGFGFLTNSSSHQIFYLVIIKFLGNPNSSPVILWSANGNSPVKENAILNLTSDGDLILRDVDGHIVWSAETSGRNVTELYLPHTSNLKLIDANNQSIWDWMDHPTNTWILRQRLKFHTRLKSSVSESNLSTGMFFLIVSRVSIDVYVNLSNIQEPQQYHTIPYEKIFPLGMGRVVLFNVNLSENRVTYNTNDDDDDEKHGQFQCIRLDTDGKINLYRFDDSSDAAEIYDLSITTGKHNLSRKHSMLVTFSVIDVIIFISVGCYCYVRWRKKEKIRDSFNIDLATNILRKFCLEDLRSATKDFQVRLGRGGFGSVFEGILDDGSKVAVKCMGSDANQGEKEFLSEVKTIGNIHHFNLVRLIGYCAERSKRVLVYEYMCNGSLDKWIFHSNALTWDTRKKIILQIARGLEYLHDHCNPNIIHFDIKPQNILLDRDFNVKISDFGVARLIDKDQTHVSTMPKGTPGYLAPELIMGSNNITVKIDIYSFGIVILEIICGRKSWKGDYLVDTVKIKAEEGQLFDLIDEKSEDMQSHKDEAVKIIQIAISCLHRNLYKRPSASMLVKVLQGLISLEPVTNYSFLNSFHVETLQDQVACPVDSAPLVATP